MGWRRIAATCFPASIVVSQERLVFMAWVGLRIRKHFALCKHRVTCILDIAFVKPLRVRSSDDSDSTIAKLRKTETHNSYMTHNSLRRHNSEDVFSKVFELGNGESVTRCVTLVAMHVSMFVCCTLTSASGDMLHGKLALYTLYTDLPRCTGID